MKKFGIYAFPGGSLEDGESNHEALIREVKEEAGLIVKPQSIKEYGTATEIRKGLWDNEIFEQHDFYYTCDAEDTILEQDLTEEEKEFSSYQLEFVSLDKAVSVNESAIQAGLYWAKRETDVLKMIKDSLMQ